MVDTLITRELLRQWGACYSDAEIAELVPERGLTALEVCDLDIPAEDRLWVLLREEVIPAGPLRMLACKWARGALTAERAAGREPDPRSWAAVDVAERFARGAATVEELAAVRYAASAAAWAAVWVAVWAASAAASDAACAAVRYAARDAAWAAARAADRAADMTAARAAAWAAAWAADRAADMTADMTAARASQFADVRAYLAQEGDQ